jgi:DNA-binding NarL/FixJ family response regulator
VLKHLERISHVKKKIRVLILDDHQSIVDGYLYRLGTSSGFEIIGTLMYGEDLDETLHESPADVLLLDINVPTARENPNPYPIIHTIANLLQQYPDLYIIVISMYAERGLIRSVMEAGASGYILKDDQASIRDLANVIRTVASGGIYFSQKAHNLYAKYFSTNGSDELLTHRQRELLSLCAAYPDWSSAELAKTLALSNSTVRNLLSNAYLRLEVHTRAAAIARARQIGLISPDAVETF